MLKDREIKRGVERKASSVANETERSALGRLSRIGLWAGLFALHAPTTVSLVGSFASATTVETLVAAIPRMVVSACSCLLFILKAMDAPWLRFAPSWRSVVTVVPVLILIHPGALEKAQSGALDVSPLVLGLVIAGGAGTSADAVTSGRSRRSGRSGRSTRPSSAVALMRARMKWPARWGRPARSARVFSFAALRAPPIH
jgi:hypothetical protein